MKKNLPHKENCSNCNSFRYSLFRLQRLRKFKRKRISVIHKSEDLFDKSSYLLSMFAMGLQEGKTIVVD